MNIEKTRVIALCSSKKLKRISKIIVDKLSSQGNIILQSYPDDEERIVFRKIDLADELFIIDNALNGKEYNKVVEYAKTHRKRIRFLSQTPLNNLINEYRKIRKLLRNIRKDIMIYRINLEEAVENGDVENIKHYSEQLRRSIIEYNDLRKKYYEVKGEIDEARI